MPRFKNGSLIKCEKSIRIYLENLNKNREFILQVLDDNHLLIKDTEVKYIMDKLSELQNDNYNEIRANI